MMNICELCACDEYAAHITYVYDTKLRTICTMILFEFQQRKKTSLLIKNSNKSWHGAQTAYAANRRNENAFRRDFSVLIVFTIWWDRFYPLTFLGGNKNSKNKREFTL